MKKRIFCLLFVLGIVSASVIAADDLSYPLTGSPWDSIPGSDFKDVNLNYTVRPNIQRRSEFCYNPDVYLKDPSEPNAKEREFQNYLHGGYYPVDSEWSVVLPGSKCYPLNYKDYGDSANSCRMVYFFVNGNPTVYYIGQTKTSFKSKSIFGNCEALVAGIRKERPNAKFLPIAKRNYQIIKRYYNR